MRRVSLIGAGNVATRMAARLRELGYEIVQQCSRTGTPVSSLDPDRCDMVIVAVSDDAIAPVLATVKSAGNAVWVHTSGSVGIDVFDAAKFPRRGVLYPLQTLLKDREVDWSEVPLLVEGDSEIETVARDMSPSIARLDTESRRRLHAAAVIGNNMVTYLWSLSRRIMQDAGLDFGMLGPLLHMTLDRSLSLGPQNAMTGPARRGDMHTISTHLAALPPDIAATYGFLSKEILKIYHPELITDQS